MCSDAIEFSETQRAGLRSFVYGQGPVTIGCDPLGKADSGRSTAGEGLCSGGRLPITLRRYCFRMDQLVLGQQAVRAVQFKRVLPRVFEENA